jgi:hypothetical protein
MDETLSAHDSFEDQTALGRTKGTNEGVPALEASNKAEFKEKNLR